MYDTGYVNACGDEEWEYIKERYNKEELPIEKVSLGFPTVLLNMDEPLDRILTVWKSVEPDEPFEKSALRICFSSMKRLTGSGRTSTALRTSMCFTGC